MKKVILFTTAVLLAIFGLLTIFLSTGLLFDLFGVRERQGVFVPFVVWTNLTTGILYLVSVFGLVSGKKWTSKLLGFCAILLASSFFGFLLHVNDGGLHQEKTFGAILFRLVLTLVFAIYAYYMARNTVDKKI